MQPAEWIWNAILDEVNLLFISPQDQSTPLKQRYSRAKFERIDKRSCFELLVF